ncbi:MAG: hypothetical protein ACKVIO_00025 [Phycisphaerales bacterium]|jgi:hypothetical protein|tara:strand:+ start:488 stop:688 length:201 start_codon:yes stop_codon:yes gene_type:complete
MVIDKPEQIEKLRQLTLLSGMKLEAKGMKISRGPTYLSRVKREFGLKGNRDKVIAQFAKIVKPDQA